jgi:hypothetical protein
VTASESRAGVREVWRKQSVEETKSNIQHWDSRDGEASRGQTSVDLGQATAPHRLQTEPSQPPPQHLSGRTAQGP